ncbi:MAG: GNAT family N-acetyltransferase [Pseudolabrys sp.]|nr:GNAT family N-acetyltransferase [Pseudolabrys sp.]MDP2298569.1 GNAT family N-acetyltransferase [Pseudolabrys sp.]
MISVLFLEDLGLMLDAVSSGSSTVAARLRPLVAKAEQGADAPSVAVFQGADAVEQAAADWQAIEHAGGATTPFQTFAMARAVADAHSRRGEIPRIAVVRHDGRPVVIFPTVLVKRFGLTVARFLGDPLIQYGDVLCEPGTGKRDLAAAWQAAADPAAAHAIHLRKVRADARIAPLLKDKATASNRDEAPFLDTGHASDGAHEEPRKLRHCRRKLSGLGTLRLDVTQGDDARRHLRDALAIKRAWLAARRWPSSVIGDGDWEEALAQLAGHGGGMRLRVAVLHVADRPAAYEVAFTIGDRWYAFIGAIVEDFARHSPGRVQVADTIHYCRANGFALYDLLAPADDVKRGYCSSAVEVTDYIRALRPSGYLLSAAVQASPAAKTLFVRLPAGLRKPILKLAGR